MCQIIRRISRKMKAIADRTYYEKSFYRNAIKGMTGKVYGKEPLICSLTTIPARIQFVKYPVLSMLHQTVRPDKIVLYLGKTLFEGVSLPEDLLALQKEGLIIRYIEDVRVHTKYYYAFQEYPDSLVMTVDDDIVYHKRLIETFLKLHDGFPQAVICSRAHRVTFDESGKVKPYQQWEWDVKALHPDMRLVATGVGSVLYTPALFRISPLSKELMLKLSPNADDLWLKAIEFANGIPVMTIQGRHWHAELPNTQEVSLNASNVHQNRNDIYWNRLCEHFGITRDALCSGH